MKLFVWENVLTVTVIAGMLLCGVVK